MKPTFQTKATRVQPAHSRRVLDTRYQVRRPRCLLRAGYADARAACTHPSPSRSGRFGPPPRAAARCSRPSCTTRARAQALRPRERREAEREEDGDDRGTHGASAEHASDRHHHARLPLARHARLPESLTPLTPRSRCAHSACTLAAALLASTHACTHACTSHTSTPFAIASLTPLASTCLAFLHAPPLDLACATLADDRGE